MLTVGGINTVIRSKAGVTSSELGSSYILIGMSTNSLKFYTKCTLTTNTLLCVGYNYSQCTRKH